uniref:Uncharacterized protein n=1 Tax=Romanomermis culicivorax TaxID=13658 RepID=A0A915IEZ4_ROMCU
MLGDMTKVATNVAFWCFAISRNMTVAFATLNAFHIPGLVCGAIISQCNNPDHVNSKTIQMLNQ